MEKQRQEVRLITPAIVAALTEQKSLVQRLEALEESCQGNPIDRPLETQIASLRVSRLLHLASINLGAVSTNLAHDQSAFAIVAPHLEADIVEFCRDQCADEVAFAPMQNIAVEAAIAASLAAVPEDLALAQQQIARARTLLDSISA